MKIFKLISASVLFFFILKSSIAQTPEDAVENVRLNFASEKIFIHFDKEAYVAGETIWFKAYFLSGVLPSQLSSSVSIDLVNDSGRVVDRKILPIINSTAAGNFVLSKDAPQMNYTVRAYTRRLMNFGKSSFYYQQLPVFNPSSPQKSPVPAKEYNLYLLPESGNLIGGIENVVAFKCTDQWGYPADAEGTIVNSAGVTVTSFKSVHDGMGKFQLRPVNGETYTAVSLLGNTIAKKVTLPHSTGSGALLSVQKINDKTYFIINSETVFDENSQPAYILAVMEDAVIFKTILPQEQKKFRGEIPEGDIPGGILQLTLFNKNDKPLAERLLFIHNKDYVAKGNFKTDTASTASRTRNVYSFQLSDSSYTSFSVAVTDADKEIRHSTDNIISRFLLTSDIKGDVHNPGYYFEADDEERKNNLDLVMLTHGWRKFTWNEILSNMLPAITYKDPNYISLKGLAYNETTGKVLSETTLSVFIKTKDSVNNLMIIPVNKDGIFEMSGLVFRDTATMFIQNTSSKNKQAQVQPNTLPLSAMFNIAAPGFMSNIKPLLFNENSQQVKNLYSTSLANADSRAVLLKEVKVTSKTKSATRLLEERYIRSGLFNGYSSKTLNLIDDPVAANTSANIFEYLKGRLSGVTITGSGGNYFLNMRGSMSLSGGLLPMSLYLDEMPLSSTLPASTIPVSQIALVKVYPTGFVGAEGSGPGGALAIYTKKGDDYYNTPGLENMFRLKVEGYSPVKEFFSPDYATGNTASRGADERSTLYWDPSLQADQSNKKISFSFYNADHVKKIRVVLEGMTSDGKLVHVERLVE